MCAYNYTFVSRLFLYGNGTNETKTNNQNTSTMTTFKAVVQRHQERRDGKFPVSIRVTHNRKVCYISTGLYCSRSQINKKTFEIKDQFVLTRTGQTILGYEKRLLEIDTEALRTMDIKYLCGWFKTSAQQIDYVAFCQSLIEQDKRKWLKLHSVLHIIRDMGIGRMSVTDFTAGFLRRFKEKMDRGNLTPNTKQQYLNTVCCVFRLLQQKYNTEFYKVITHDPFVGLENYKVGTSKKRSLGIEQLRRFFTLIGDTEREQVVLDILRMSFCMCGVNLLDLQLMEWKRYDVAEKRISFARHKTKDKAGNRVEIAIRFEPEIEPFVEKYRTSEGHTLLFDFGNGKPSRSFNQSIAKQLHNICKKRGIEPITPYQFRHTWATIARNNCDVSKDDIDLCLAHVGNNPMADVYIRPDWSRIDRANRKVLDYVFYGTE